MHEIWLALVCALLAGYAVMDGFDLGAGMLHRTIGRTAEERAEVFAAIGPFWAGNEVFLVAAGGTMLLALPKLLAAAFSGMYLASFALLWALLLRGLSIELRDHLDGRLWRSFFDTTFVISSALIAALLGVALGNVVRGVPLQDDGYFHLPLFASLLPRGEIGLLDSYTALCGLLALAMLAAHGSLYLAYKSHGPVAARAATLARRLVPLSAALWFAAWGYTLHVRADMAAVQFASARGALAALCALCALCVLCWAVWRIEQHERAKLRAFLASCAWLLSTAIAAALLSYPTLLGSSSSAPALTLAASAAPDSSLRAALWWWPLAALLTTGYFTLLFRIHRGKLRAAERQH